MFPVLLQAQSSNAGTPYSRFGLGEVQSFNLVANRSMGGLAVAYFDPLSLNITNPAGMGGIRLTTFEFAAAGKFLTLSSNTQTQQQSNFNINYFVLGFPVTKKWGAAFGFLPFSTNNYAISTQVDSSFQKWKEVYNGLGGINRVFLTNGYSINDQWHVGVTANFLFGTLNQERRIEFPDTTLTFNVRIQDEVRLADANFQLGVQYRRKLSNDRKITAGAVVELPTNMNATRTFLADRFTYRLGSILVRDTVSDVPSTKGSVLLPLAYSFGLTYEIGTRWLFGIEARMQDWSDFSFLGSADSLRNSMTFSGGAQYVPDANAAGKSNYFKTIRYRTGFRYNSSYLQLRDQPINEVGITVGATLPIRRSNSAVSVAYEGGIRGTTSNGLIREQFNRVSIAFTLNDRWFIKRKYD